MMESVALPGGGGVKAAIKGYRIAIKTGTAKKVGPDGRYINKYIAYTAGVAPASQPRFALVVVINDPQAVNTTAAPFPRRYLVPSWRRSAHHEHRTGRAGNGRKK
ncbi:penicillin-binding protein 3 [Salmonella enterica subsp. enterica]|uniref:Penicillin-binding protein 3 n=1 Tax=Salmonella enterica I TaxID=59201 RepID=A0A379WF84_SALET|nr:penicillin-binding protein 3 [Salmonella enterica subsp. enterica]